MIDVKALLHPAIVDVSTPSSPDFANRIRELIFKARPDVIAQLCRIAEQERVILGEVIKHALNAFQRDRVKKG